MILDGDWSQTAAFCQVSSEDLHYSQSSSCTLFLIPMLWNPDERCRSLSDEHKGVFMDSIHALIHYCVYVQAARGMLLLVVHDINYNTYFLLRCAFSTNGSFGMFILPHLSKGFELGEIQHVQSAK